jgi:hypothetical protein
VFGRSARLSAHSNTQDRASSLRADDEGIAKEIA